MEYARDLGPWIQAQQAKGSNFTQTVVTLALQFGYAVPVAQRIVEAVLDHEGNSGRLVDESCGPAIDTASESTHLDLGDIHAQLVFEQLAPRIVLLDHFMTDAECAAICELAAPMMRDAVIAHGAGGTLRSDRAVRDADSAVLLKGSSPIVNQIDKRISMLTGWPVSHGEHLQVQRYRPDGRYAPHYDFFEANAERALRAGGQRVATLIVYLRSPDAGGATYLANLGMRIKPRRGSALFFTYPEADPQSGTLHAGDTVQHGEKWILTKWLRERAVESSGLNI
ncbi:prolyl 4-hydroxylase [Duganella sacchari]|uniref:Prolyl 4-hydroxylase n=1 Tax=Duganella sacchari TaxID=551987 RepID=A0A1M7PRM0_9BURK|nr:2OG-Fe(II) oxygenase [Duganella sacchari]SHN19978.1 prolyl 4-hydroxylase [Duganella sacchari]